MAYVFGLIGLGALMLISGADNKSILETLSGVVKGPTQNPLVKLPNSGGSSNDGQTEKVGAGGSYSGGDLLLYLAEVADKRFNLTVTEYPGYGRDKGKKISGGHTRNSAHYQGRAFDAHGSKQNMRAFSFWLITNHLSSIRQGIHNPNLSVNNGKQVPKSFWGPITWAAHAGHVHVEA